MEQKEDFNKNFVKVYIKVETMEALMMLASVHIAISAIQIGFNDKQYVFETCAEFAQSYSSWTLMCYKFIKANYNENDWSVFFFKINQPGLKSRNIFGKFNSNKTQPIWIAFVCWPVCNFKPSIQIVNNVFLRNLHSICDLFGPSLVHVMYPLFPKGVTFLDIMQQLKSVPTNMFLTNNIKSKESNTSLWDMLESIRNVVVQEKMEKFVVVSSKNDTPVKSILNIVSKNNKNLKTRSKNENVTTTDVSTSLKKVKFVKSNQLVISHNARKWLKLTQNTNNGLFALKIVFNTFNCTFDVGNGIYLHEFTVNLSMYQKLKMPKCKDFFNLFMQENLNLNEFAIYIVKYYTLDYLDLTEKPYWVSVSIGPPVETSKSPIKVAFLENLTNVYDMLGLQLLVVYDAEKAFPATFGLKPLLNMKKQIELGNRTILDVSLDEMWSAIEMAANGKLHFENVGKMATFWKQWVHNVH